MPSYRLNIGRINVSLQGVSASVAEEIRENLAAELGHRLGDIRLSDRISANRVVLSPPPMQIHSAVDGPTLRGLIAEGLSNALRGEFGADNEDVGGP